MQKVVDYAILKVMVIIITKINSDKQLANVSQSLVNTEPMMAHDSGLLAVVENNEVYQKTRSRVDSFFDGLDNTSASLVVSRQEFNLIKDGVELLHGVPEDSIVVIYNSDFIIPRGAVKSMVNCLRFLFGVGIVSAMRTDAENVARIISGNIYEPASYNKLDHEQIKEQSRGDGLYSVDLVDSNLFAIRKRDLEGFLSQEQPYEGYYGLSLRKYGLVNVIDTNILIRKEDEWDD